MSYNEKVETRMGAKRATKEPDPKMQPKHVIKNITAPPEGFLESEIFLITKLKFLFQSITRGFFLPSRIR